MSYYYDAYEVYELLDKWNHRGPPIIQSVIELFERNPNASKQEFVFGQTLLHKSIEAYMHKMDLIQVLIDSYPQALSIEDDNGYLPLHIALTTTGCPPPNLQLIKLFLDTNPESIVSTVSSGAFPLHLACQQGCTIDVIKYLVGYFPDVLQYRDKENKFPLDYALENNNGTTSRIKVIEYLIKSYPIILTFCDCNGMLPLHRVMKQQQKQYGRKSSDNNTYGQNKIVDLLVESCPGSLLFQNNEGQTPLLQACQDDNSLSQIYSLVRNWPEQVTTQRNMLVDESHIFNGHMLPSTLSSKSIQLHKVQEWIQYHPDIIEKQDVQGRLPLHYAVVSSSEEVLEIVQFLVEKQQQQQQQLDDNQDDGNGGSNNDISNHAIAIPDHHGRLPIHYAAAVAVSSSTSSSSSSQEVIDYLINKYPNGLKHVDNDGRLPWHYGDCSRQDNVFEKTCELYPNMMNNDTNLDLIPEEIRWDIIQVLPTE